MYKKRHSVLWILSSILEFRIQACFMLANTPSWETELQIYGIARVIGGMSRIITITRHLAQRFLLHWFASIISIQSSCEYSLLKDPNSSLINISEQSCGRPPLFQIHLIYANSRYSRTLGFFKILSIYLRTRLLQLEFDSWEPIQSVYRL
jgi:hypothetical protein